MFALYNRVYSRVDIPRPTLREEKEGKERVGGIKTRIKA
jgi:hypothetical protein